MGTEGEPLRKGQANDDPPRAPRFGVAVATNRAGKEPTDELCGRLNSLFLAAIVTREGP